MWALKNLSSVVSASRVVASVWEGGEGRMVILHILTSYWDRGLSFRFLTPENGACRLSRNFGKKLPLLAA